MIYKHYSVSIGKTVSAGPERANASVKVAKCSCLTALADDDAGLMVHHWCILGLFTCEQHFFLLSFVRISSVSFRAKVLSTSGCVWHYRGTRSNSQLWNLCLALQRRPWDVLFLSQLFNPLPQLVFFSLRSFFEGPLRDGSRLWLMHTRQKLTRLPETLRFLRDFLQPCVWFTLASGRGGKDQRGSSYHQTRSFSNARPHTARVADTAGPLPSLTHVTGQTGHFNWVATVLIKYQRECWWVASDCSIRNSLTL